MRLAAWIIPQVRAQGPERKPWRDPDENRRKP
jgi:hypothetical protein